MTAIERVCVDCGADAATMVFFVGQHRAGRLVLVCHDQFACLRRQADAGSAPDRLFRLIGAPELPGLFR